MTVELIGTAEIAELLGVSRRHAVERVISQPDFPKPVVNLSQKTRRWAMKDVLQYVSRPHKRRTESLTY